MRTRGPSGRENLRHLCLELMFPVGDLAGMHPVETRELVDGLVPFDGVQRDPRFELRTVSLPLCRPRPAPRRLNA
jgi:hypothetical protein